MVLIINQLFDVPVVVLLHWRGASFEILLSNKQLCNLNGKDGNGRKPEEGNCQYSV